MSADNGILIVAQDDGTYEVRYYCASLDYDTYEEMTLLQTCPTLEEAIERGEREGTEYGLHFL